MSLFGPVTDAERRGWQLRDARALLNLLAAAHEAGLPPLVWELGLTGLYGRSVAVNMPERRAEFDAWAQFFGDAGNRPAEQTYNGKTRLRVVCRYGAAPGVNVAVITDIYETEETED